MKVESTSSVGYQSNQITKHKETLGKNDFLKILVTQLRTQNPLEPLDDKEFVTQLAQFSSLEQMQNLNALLGEIKGVNLIGKKVVVKTDSGSLEDTVESIKFLNGEVYLNINGNTYNIDDLLEIKEE